MKRLFTLWPLYASAAVLATYDGGGADDPPPAKDTYSKAEYEAALSAARGENSKVVKDLEAKLAGAKGLSAQEKAQFEEQINTLRGLNESASEKAEREKAALATAAQNKDKEWGDKYTAVTSKYEKAVIGHALTAAAAGADAFSADQVILVLGPMTKIVPNSEGVDEVVVTMREKDKKSGEYKDLTYSPADAIAKLKEDARYWNLFKSNVAPGIGGHSGGGAGGLNKDGTIDITKLTSAEYRHLRKTNPRALGLDRDPQK